MSPQCTFIKYRRPLTKTTTITRTFPPGAARPFAFTAFRLTLLDGKKFDFVISDSKFLNRAQVYFMLPTSESIPVMAGNYCMSAPRRRKSRMRNS